MGLDNPLHIAFVLIVLLLVFGARRLPEIGRGLGQGLREFKSTLTGATTAASPAAVAPPSPELTASELPAETQAAEGARS